MNNFLKGLLLILLVGLITSCGKDETCSDGIQNGNETGIDCGGDCTPCETTVADDKANIQKTFDDLLMCTQNIKDSRSVTVFFKDFLNLSDGEALNEDWLENLTEDLEDVLDAEHVEDNSRFDLSYHAGTHIYDAANETWVKTNNVSDKMIFQFPSEPTSMTNNVELVLDGYTDKQVVIDDETMSLPTSMHMYMDIDEVKLMEINIANITYADNANYQFPVEISAQVFMDPMDITMEVTRVSTTEYQMEMAFSDGDLCDIKVNAQMELTDDDFENLASESFEKVALQVNVGKLSIQTLGDVATLLSLDDPTENQINSLLDLDLFFNDLKIGDLELNDDDETVIVFYKDGTFEDSSVFYDGFFDDIADIWAEFFG